MDRPENPERSRPPADTDAAVTQELESHWEFLPGPQIKDSLLESYVDDDIAEYEWDSEDLEPALVTAAARMSSWVYSPEASLESEWVGPWELDYEVRREVHANSHGGDVQKATVAVTFDRAAPPRRLLALAIVFRGTTRLQDWLQTVACVENRTRFQAYGIGVHSGMWTYVENDFFEHGHVLFSDLEFEYQRGASLLMFVGHSLGGGMACMSQLLGLLALEHPQSLPCHEQMARDMGPGVCWLLRSARAITFAAPMTFVPMYEKLVIEAHLRKKCVNFVNNNDLVPRLPGHQEFITEAFNGCGRIQVSLVGVPTFMASWTLDVGDMVEDLQHEVPARNRYRHFGTQVLLQANGSAVSSGTVQGCEKMLRQKRRPTSSGGFLNWWSNDAYDAGMDHTIARHISSLPWFARYENLKLQVESARDVLWLADRDLRDSDLAQLSRDLVHNQSIKKLDLSKNRIGDVGVGVLVKMFMNSNHGLRHQEGGKLASMVLSWNSIGDIGASALADYLKASANLKELRLDGNWIGEVGAVALAEALFENSTLKCLHIAGDMFSGNRIGDAGTAALAGALQHNSSLTALLLTRCNMGPLGADTLANSIKVNQTLTLLHVSDNHIGNYGANALAKSLASSKAIQDVSLDEAGLGHSCAESIAYVLNECFVLHRLGLAGNEFGDIGLRLLSKAWECNSGDVRSVAVNLRELNLDSNQIGAGGAGALATVLQSSRCRLQHLSVASNCIGDAGVHAMAQALQRNATLQELILSSNVIGDEGACAIAFALHKITRLYALDLTGNTLRDAGARAFATLLANQRDKGLKRLFLSGNCIEDAGGNLLAEGLRRNVNVKEFNIMGNHLSPGTLEKINAALTWDDDHQLIEYLG